MSDEAFVKKIIYGIAAIFILILVTFALVGESIYSSSAPRYSGTFHVPNLSSQVEILRDKEGVPHLYASNRKDLYIAFGRTIASDRLFQMDILRRVGAGRLSEILGKKTLDIDKLFRTIGAHRKFEKLYKEGKLNPQMIEQMEWFLQGVNDYISEHTLPVEFHLLSYRPDPFTVPDIYGFIAYMAYGFSPALNQDPLFSRWKKLFSPEVLEKFRVDPHPMDNKEVSLDQASKVFDKVQDILQSYFYPIEGSNAWVMSGEKTASKRPILASDPHIRYSLPGVWYEAHLNLKNEKEEFEMYGHFLPLIPFAALGHNRNYGWGLTMSYIDDMDLYREKVEGDSYYYEGRAMPLEIKSEKIIVRGGEDYDLSIKSTRNGPLLNEVLGENLSLKWAFLLEHNRPVEAFYGMNHAKDYMDFKKAIAMGSSPGLNILYADSSNNIGHWLFGEIPLRKRPYESDFVYNGETSDDDYLGYMDFDKKPHLFNPKEGVIVSANNRFPGSDQSIRGWWQVSNRFNTISFLIDQRNDWGLEGMKSVQTSTFDIDGLKDKDLLVDALSDFSWDGIEKEAFVALKAWNGRSDLDSINATIFHQFTKDINELVLDELDHEEYLRYCKTQAQWHFFRRLLRDVGSDIWDFKDTGARENRGQALQRIFKHTVAQLQKELGRDIKKWQWGRLHTLEFAHPLGVVWPLDKIFNVGPYPINGAINAINHHKRAACDGGHRVGSGPSTRRLIDFSRPEVSYGILPLGNSGHSASLFFDDQRERFFEGVYRLQLLDRIDIEKNLHGTLFLLPKNP